MANNANIRFNNANVAYVNIDTETHAMTGGVMDETTGTFYPASGGNTMPKLHIKFNNEAVTPLAVFGNQQIFNKLGSNGLEASAVMLVMGASLEADFLYIYDNNVYTGYDTPEAGAEITNLVNCTVDNDSGISYITITDSNLDASAEISAKE